MMIPLNVKKQIISEFAKNKKLTLAQKERLLFLIAMTRVSYEIGEHFSKYIKKNRVDIQAFLHNLDSESKNEVKIILKDLEYMNTFTVIDTIKRIFNRVDEIMEHINDIEVIKKKYVLSMDFYQESVFKFKHGLKFLPHDRIRSLEDKDFLDCGAFVGESALMFERDYHPKKIYSFEPLLDNYTLLLDTIKINNLNKVIPINKGVGKKSGTAYICAQGSASYISDKNGDVKIELISIDEFTIERNLSVGLIKLDVEGYEFAALEGAKKTIEKFKPVLLIGIYHNPEEFFGTIRYIQSILSSYRFRIKHLVDLVPLNETYLIAW